VHVDADLTTVVVVVGAGVIGASTAYHLARAGLRVLVVDAFNGPAEGSTGPSFTSIRAQWADALNIELSWRSIKTYRSFAEELGIDVGYRPSGYLYLVPESACDAHLVAVDLQRAHGVSVEVLDVHDAQPITEFAVEGLGGATLGPENGVVDPHLATSAYLQLARSAGAQVSFRHRVTAVERSGTSWILSGGDTTIHAETVVNAAGGWAGELARLAGLTVPVVHSRRNVYSSSAGALLRPVPMTTAVDTGVFVRSEGSRLLFGAARPDQVDGISIDYSLAGIFGAIGALTALHARERTGRGQVVDSAIYEAVLALMESLIPEWEVADYQRERTGAILPNVAPSNTYPTRETADVLIAANQDSVFARLAHVMGTPELAADPRFASHGARGGNQEKLDRLITDWTQRQHSEDVLSVLHMSGVPAGRVYRASDMLADEHFLARQAIVRVAHKHFGEIPVQNVFPRLSETPGKVRWVGPELGENTVELLSGLLEMSHEQIADLAKRGVV
jgi:glycine/D-amino acid oxidase-like deaminating enzyme